MLFDSHVHFFPEKLKGKVLPKLSEISNCNYFRDETRESAVELLNRSGGTHCLALHIATNPMQQESVNNFAAASQSDNVLCFGSVHPKSLNAIEELYRIKELGLRGVKLHPDYQDFFASELSDIYSTCAKLALPIAFHTGKDPYSPRVIHCPPTTVKKIAVSFPTLTIIAAHMGGMDMSDECESELVGTDNVYFDTAFASHFLSPKKLEKLIRLHGIDKILFATDSPWSTIEAERELIENTLLTTLEKEQIYFCNAARLFNISC